MTKIEHKLQAALHREAAELIPDGTEPPGLTAEPVADGRYGFSAWLSRWRTPLLAAAAVVVVAGAITDVAVQQRGGGQAAIGPSDTGNAGANNASGASELPAFTDSGTSRVKSYQSLAELAGDSTNIVIADATGETRPETGPAIAIPANTLAELSVMQVLAGTDIAAGTEIEVISPGEDTAGRPALTASGRYLLFLAPFTYGPNPDGTMPRSGSYVIVGYLAGLYYQAPGSQAPAAAGGDFRKLDPDSPDLPSTVDAASLDLTAGWSDAEYLDHVGAGILPEFTTPLHAPVGSVASDVIRGTAPSFTCGDGLTTAATSGEEGWLLFGMTQSSFCFGFGSSEVGTAGKSMGRSDEVAADGPLRALVRVTGPSDLDSRVGVLVDGSVTAVRAIRGNDDAADASDPIPDTVLDLYQLGDLRAFVLPDDAQSAVLYSGGVEVARKAFGGDHIDNPDADVQLYDLRNDLTDLRAQAWTAWTQASADVIRIYFQGGQSACYGAVVTVDESADVVRIGLHSGWKPEAAACTDDLVQAAVDVQLAAPLAGRAVDALPEG